MSSNLPDLFETMRMLTESKRDIAFILNTHALKKVNSIFTSEFEPNSESACDKYIDPLVILGDRLLTWIDTNKTECLIAPISYFLRDDEYDVKAEIVPRRGNWDIYYVIECTVTLRST